MLGESLKIEVWRKVMIGFCFDLFFFGRISSIVFFFWNLNFKTERSFHVKMINDQCQRL